MKKIILLCVFAIALSNCKNTKNTDVVAAVVEEEVKGINWVTVEEAMELQKNNPKKVMIDAYTKWCGPCKMLDRNTFTNQDLISYVNEHYYAVKFNAEGNAVVNFKDKTYTNPNYKDELKNRRNSAHEFSRFLGVNAYPTLVFLDEQANLIAPVRGYQTPTQLELYLKLFKDDGHKTITSQVEFQEYANSFVPQFKDS